MASSLAKSPTASKKSGTVRIGLATDAKQEIKIKEGGRYPLVPLRAITIVPRPETDEEPDKIFYNARGPEQFSLEEIDSLITDIRVDGLHNPLLVRAFTDNKGRITKIELIAGERRDRSLTYIVDNDLPSFDESARKPKQFKPEQTVVCKGRIGTVVRHQGESVLILFDDREDSPEPVACNYEDVFPTVSGAKLYEYVPCKVIYDCTDERAVRLNFKENKESAPLPIKDEIALVRRFERAGYKQERIAEILGENVTWVSQTANFEYELPGEAFAKLLKGEIVRNVAVRILSFQADDRELLYNKMVVIEAKQSNERIKQHKEAKDANEDLADCHLADARKADKAGDSAEAARCRKRAGSASNKAKKAGDRLKRAIKDKGRLTEGHVRAAASEAGLMTRRAKPLDREEIERCYVKGLTKYLGGDATNDPLTNEKLPLDLVGIVRRTAIAILHGERDALAPIRDYMCDNGRWNRPLGAPPASTSDSDLEEFDEFDEADEVEELDEELAHAN